MNMELWNKVKKRFEDHPECVDMNILSDSPVPSCMTVGCIAGWTIFEAKESASYNRKYKYNGFYQASDLLGIDFEAAKDLFFLSRWPLHLKELYTKDLIENGHPARAVLAAMNAFERGDF